MPDLTRETVERINKSGFHHGEFTALCESWLAQDAALRRKDEALRAAKEWMERIMRVGPMSATVMADNPTYALITAALED